MMLNVALVPPAQAQEAAIRISKQISDQVQTYFTLDGTTRYPHVTLYATQYKNQPEGKLRDRLQSALSKHRAGTGQVGSITVSPSGYVGLKVEAGDELQTLQEEIIAALKDLRDTSFDPEEAYAMKLSPEALRNYAEAGYDKWGELFDPHLTLTRVADATSAESVVNGIEWPHSEITFVEVGLFESGEHGTCVRRIDSWNLVAS